MARFELVSFAVLAALGASPARAAEPVMVQCGRDYQAAKAAGTLNGMDWARYRLDCATRLKGSASSVAAAPVAVPAVGTTVLPPSTTAASPVPPPAASGGRAAMNQRQKRCGAEWTSQKAVLVAQTPGLTWPRYWSLCNTRLKAAGG